MVPDPIAGTSVVQSKKRDALVAWTQLRPCIISVHKAATFFDLSNETLGHACKYDLDQGKLPTADGGRVMSTVWVDADRLSTLCSGLPA